ncbi:MAG: methyltransferase domain-containing protein [Pseudomonadota bacterium]
MTTRQGSAEVRTLVREAYGPVAASPHARSVFSSCHPVPRHAGSCSGSGLGCGDPLALARLRRGESVLDLGSGAGYECLAAAVEVGRQGQVIGIDVTPEMVTRARRNAIATAAPNVSFVVGDIQSLPFSAGSFDVVISNCVVNLCPDKTRVFAETRRVLRCDGRLALSDIVAIAPLPSAMVGDLALYAACVASAPTADRLRE